MSLLTKKLKQEQGLPLPASPPEEPKAFKTAWEYYNEGMEIIDREREKEWMEQMDTILIFAALFAGFLSSFLIELLGRLEPDPIDIIQDVLIYQTQMMRNSSLGPYVPPDFSPPEYIVVVNALFYASLGVILLAAFIAMLIKGWVREFDRGLRAMSLPEQRAKTREFRFLGMERWKLPEMVGILPLLIHISLLLFSIGLILFLFYISKPSFGVTTVIFGIGILYYGTTMSISVFVTSSPFHSPLSRTLATVYQQMGITPTTALGRVRRFIRITLLKSRPYLEEDFAYPIVGTTMRGGQLSIAASALHRIHESAPDSQHSEALHWSVWQVAGSESLSTPPLFNLPYWILAREDDEEYFLQFPPDMLVALVAVSLRAPYKWRVENMTTVRVLLQRMETCNVPWAEVVSAVFDHIYLRLRFRDCGDIDIEDLRQTESNLTNVTRRKRLHTGESLWLLSTLSEYRNECWRPGRLERESFLIGICLAILSDHAPEWDDNPFPPIALLEAAVTLAAMSCSLVNLLHTPTSSHEHPWLLRNLRNPALFANWFEDTPSEHHEQLISLLLLVIHALICRDSYPLAVQYLTVITSKGGLPLYTSALAVIAPVIDDSRLFVISRILVAPQTQELIPIMRYRTLDGERVIQEELLGNYERRIGDSENPDPNFLAIVFMLSKHVPSGIIEELRNVHVDLKNPWLRLAARVVARLDIPDGSGLPTASFYDHRVHNMIAALSLLRYTTGTVTQYTEFLLLESFLESRELSISSVALEYYMRTAISYPGPPAPSHCLSTTVSAVFNFALADHSLWMGWTILDIFVDGFETLSGEWRRSFAEGFFTLSRRPLLKPRGDAESMTRDSEIQQILTWEYFHEEEQEREWTDSGFSGLDWMAMAWSLHLSQQSEREKDVLGQGEAKWRNLSGPAVNEEFVLKALCKLLDAASPYQLISLIPKLCEFVQWFGDIDLPEYRRMVWTRIEEASRMHVQFQKLHFSHKFHCMWHI